MLPANGAGMAYRTYSATLSGISGVVIEVEAARQDALPQIHITGLPGEIIRESRERVRACLNHLGFAVPSSRLVVNLSPAGARKQGSQFDLAIAVSVLFAEGMLKNSGRTRLAFLGELALDGRVLRVAGVTGLLEPLERREDIDLILIPRDNLWEAKLLGSRKARPVRHLGEVLEFIAGKNELGIGPTEEVFSESPSLGTPLDDVLGQTLGKRALEISLAGRHHLLFVGSPGVGKSLLSACAPALLPRLEREEWIDVVKNYTYCPEQRPSDRFPPFRAPHHSISGPGLLGGGSGIVVPGEVTLAHGGVLFLDELPEFRRDLIEGLREPLQNGNIHLHRIGHSLQLPAKFTLIAAMNPCACGYALSDTKRCRCSTESVLRYQRRVSGAIMDRIDISVVLSAPKRRDWKASSRTHADISQSIARARDRQRARNGGLLNADLGVKVELPPFFLGAEERAWFDELYDTGILSFRSLHKIVRVARTIADLEGAEQIGLPHLKEARLLRCPESYIPAFR